MVLAKKPDVYREKKMARKSRTRVADNRHNGWVNEHLLTHGNIFLIDCAPFAFKWYTLECVDVREIRLLNIKHAVNTVSFAGKHIESSK